MKFDSYITSNTKIAYTVRINTKKSIFDKFYLEKAAFTLAETLITLTIIGVIAALTIPNLISSYQKHTYVVGLKKAYSQLQNAVKMIPITQGCPAGDFDCVGWNEEWNKATNIEGQEFNGKPTNKKMYVLSKQFKINKLCYEDSTDETCEKIRYSFNSNLPSFITQDGTIYMQVFDSYNTAVDINGFNGPNKFGRDRFTFYITTLEGYRTDIDTVVPFGSRLYADLHWDDFYWKTNNNCTTEKVNKDTGTDWYELGTCTGRVLEEDAMNY